MTEQPTHLPPVLGESVQPAAPVVTPPTGGRLEQLHAQYSMLKAAADEAGSLLKACTDAIKVELSTACPDQATVELRGPAGPGMRLTYSESWRIDTPRFKREQPEIYVTYAKKSGSWKLAQIKGGE